MGTRSIKPGLAHPAAPFAPVAPIDRATQGVADGQSLSVGIAFLMAFLVLNFSRIPDLLLPGLYLPFLASTLALVALVFSGGIGKPFGTLGGRFLTALTFWLIVAVPFSIWKGGSVDFMRNVWLKSFMVFVLIAGLTRTVQDCRRLMASLGVAGFLVVLFVPLMGVDDVEGRLSLGAGVLDNPNELGMLVLILAPFVWFLAHSAPRWSLRKIASWLALLGMAPIVVATGSRGTLLGLLTMVLAVIALQRWSRRIAIAILVTLVATIAVLFAPDAALQRYTVFSTGETVDLDENRAAAVAAASSDARFHLLMQSVRLTLSRPLVGYGPGQFQAAERDLSIERGEVAAWHESHNSYTQVSSEAGIPALLLFLGALFLPMRRVRRLARDPAKDPHVLLLARVLGISFAGFAVGAFFNSVAYSVYVTTFVGLAEGLLTAAAPARSPAAAVATVVHGPSGGTVRVVR